MLRPARDGSNDLVHDAAGFTARIAPDGTVTFKDNLTALHWLPFAPAPGPQNVPSLQSTLSDLMQRRRVRTREDRPVPPPTNAQSLSSPVLTPFRPDPREDCRWCSDFLGSFLPFAAMGWDFTDEVMRMAGDDPYRYEKVRFSTTPA